MRTTVTLDPDVAARLKELSHRTRASFKATLNQALRRGLAAQERGREVTPFVVKPHPGGFQPGIDVARLNQLVDRLDAEKFKRKARRRR